MALMPSLAIPSTPKFRVKLFQFHRCSEIHLPHQKLHARTRSINVSMADRDEPNEVKMRIEVVREKFGEVIPTPVREFPWRKAERVVIDRILFLVQEALKWSLVLFFVVSSLSDVVYTFSRNCELIMPVGLFVGCLLSDLLKEISQELFHKSVEKDLKWHLLGMYGLFVLVKFLSTQLAVRPQVFLLHVANGGLMQILWYWRKFMEDAENKQEENSASGSESLRDG